MPVASVNLPEARTTDGPIRWELRYHNLATGLEVHSVGIDTLDVDGDRATFGGTCLNIGPCTF